MNSYKINKERLIKTFTDLVRIPSPSWGEHRVIDYIAARLEKSGAHCKKIKCEDSFNLYVSVKGNRIGKPVLFSAHTDTVNPCFNVTPSVTKTRISSAGDTILGGDNKAAIAMFIEAVETLKETGQSYPDFELLLTCAEEVGLMGIKNFDLTGLKAEYAFVFDSDGDIGRIITAAPYHYKLKMTVTGRAAHAGMEPEKGINAINSLASIICALPSGRIDEETTVNVGTIEGGSATNIVAPSAECHLEVRSISKQKATTLIKEIRNTAKTTAASSGARVKTESVIEYPGYRIRDNDHIVSAVRSAMKSITVNPAIAVSGGGSDTNIFNRSGIKAVNLSCGMRNMHSSSEYVLIKDMVNGARLTLALLDHM